MYLHKKILKIFFVLAIFSISYTFTSLYVLYTQNSIALPDLWHDAMDVIAPDWTSCYYATKSSYSQLIDEIPMANDSIFFHEITCQRALGLREACSVESIARAHPNRKVIVIFTRALTKRDCEIGTLAELNKLSNVHFYTVDLNTYARDTPLQNIFIARNASLGRWHYRRIGGFLKFLTLYKFGGVVVDFDMMVVDSVDKLGENWASTKSGSLESGIISVSRDHFGKYYSRWFITALKHQIARNGAVNEESALREVLKALCNTTDVDEMKRRRCKGFHVYSDEFYNPGNSSYEDFKATNTTVHRLGYHSWSESSDRKPNMPSDSLYARLARKHCPFVFRRFMYDENEEVIHL